MKIIFTGGGTGGHIFPIIAIAREIKRLSAGRNLALFYLGPKDPFAKKLLLKEGIKVRFILSGKLRRYLTLISFFQNIFDIFFKIPFGILQSLFYIFFFNPDLIFSKGGYGSVPVIIAAKLLLVPVFLHESDSVPGMANRFLANFSLEIFVSFANTPYFPKRKMILVGNPIRTDLIETNIHEAQAFFNLSGEKPVVLILGGSQGAQRINDRILEILPEFLKDFELIHQCGEKNFQQVKKEAEVMINLKTAKFYHLFPFLNEEELKKAYAVSDLIVSRAGSGSIFEIAAVGKPSMLIPLPESAQGHQIKNAYIFAQRGATIVLEEENFTARFFLERIRYLFDNPQLMERMGLAAKNFSRPRAARIIAEYIYEYLNQK